LLDNPLIFITPRFYCVARAGRSANKCKVGEGVALEGVLVVAQQSNVPLKDTTSGVPIPPWTWGRNDHLDVVGIAITRADEAGLLVPVFEGGEVGIVDIGDAVGAGLNLSSDAHICFVVVVLEGEVS